MQIHPVLLRVTAVVLWGGTWAAAAIDADGETWGGLALMAAVVSLGALQQMLVAKSAKIYEAQTRAVLTRPFYRGDTGPLPAIPLQAVPDDAPARPSAAGRHAARHGTR